MSMHRLIQNECTNLIKTTIFSVSIIYITYFFDCIILLVYNSIYILDSNDWRMAVSRAG